MPLPSSSAARSQPSRTVVQSPARPRHGCALGTRIDVVSATPPEIAESCGWSATDLAHPASGHLTRRRVHRGPITKQGSTLVRWAAVEAAQKTPAWAGWLVRSGAGIAERRGREHRHRRGGPHAAHPRLLRARAGSDVTRCAVLV
jgi:hypothetical protein